MQFITNTLKISWKWRISEHSKLLGLVESYLNKTNAFLIGANHKAIICKFPTMHDKDNDFKISGREHFSEHCKPLSWLKSYLLHCPFDEQEKQFFL